MLHTVLAWPLINGMTIANEKMINQNCLFLNDFYSDANKTCVIWSLISVEVICKVWLYILEVQVKTKQLSMTIREKNNYFYFIKKGQSVKGLSNLSIIAHQSLLII